MLSCRTQLCVVRKRMYGHITQTEDHSSQGKCKQSNVNSSKQTNKQTHKKQTNKHTNTQTNKQKTTDQLKFIDLWGHVNPISFTAHVI